MGQELGKACTGWMLSVSPRPSACNQPCCPPGLVPLPLPAVLGVAKDQPESPPDDPGLAEPSPRAPLPALRQAPEEDRGRNHRLSRGCARGQGEGGPPGASRSRRGRVSPTRAGSAAAMEALGSSRPTRRDLAVGMYFVRWQTQRIKVCRVKRPKRARWRNTPVCRDTLL